MRDIAAQSSRFVWKQVDLESEVCPQAKDYVYTLNQTSLVNAHGRSDVVKSDHVRPTLYKGYRYSVTFHAGDLMSTYSYRTYCGGYKWYRKRRYGFLTNGLVNSSAYENLLVHDWSQGGVTPKYDNYVLGVVDNQLLAKIANSQASFGEDLGEIRETAQMMEKRSAQVLRMLLYLRRGQFARAAKVIGLSKRNLNLKSAADAFLELKFGWLPVLESIYHARSSIMHAFGQSQKLATVSAHYAQTYTRDDWVGQNQRTGKVKYETTAQADYRCSDPTLAGLNALGILNPASVAWNLMPMSFVIDWFISVGSFLDGLSAPIGLTYGSGFHSHRTEAEFSFENFGHAAELIGCKGTNPKATVRSSGFRRIPDLGFPTPAITIRLGLNPNRVLTLLALLAQRG